MPRLGLRAAAAVLAGGTVVVGLVDAESGAADVAVDVAVDA